MASDILYLTLLCIFFILNLPCRLTAEEQDDLTPEEWRYENCVKKCVRELRFPCEEGLNVCGGCMVPFSTPVGNICEKATYNEHQKEWLLDMINKRDEGTDGLGVDIAPGGAGGGASDPDPDPADAGNNPPPSDEDQGDVDTGVQEDPLNAGDAGAGGAGSVESNEEGSYAVNEENGEVRAHQTNNGSVILLAEWQFILIVVGCVAVAIIGVAIAFICWYKIQTTSKAQNEADYPAYGVTGPGTQIGSSINNGDRKLAQSAQMYHYQHQKQQMIAMEKQGKGDVAHDASDYDSEEENEDGDVTVYECPGLAPTGEMQVKNPLFAEDAYPKQEGEDEQPEKQ